MIELTAGIIMVVSSLTASPIMTDTIYSVTDVSSTSTSQIITASSTSKEVEEYVRNFYKKTPILAEVSRCESQFRHFNSKGKILRGMVVDKDVGVMQINETYHLENSKKMGLDILDLNDNLQYGKYLYDTYGVQPWSASEPCWGKRAVALNLK